MIVLTILSLLTTFTIPDVPLEQKAVDYFFTDIFKQEYGKYKVIEFDTQTNRLQYYGIVYNCKEWDKNENDLITSATPEKSVTISANIKDLRIKKIREKSKRLKIRISSRIKVGDHYYVSIALYKAYEFTAYYFIEFDQHGNILETCKTGETI